jgi:hypothetical protein
MISSGAREMKKTMLKRAISKHMLLKVLIWPPIFIGPLQNGSSSQDIDAVHFATITW